MAKLILIDMNKNITKNILFAFVLGIIFGIGFNFFENITPLFYSFFVNTVFDTGGAIFLKVLKMLVVPIVFCSLICGVCNLNDFSSLGRISIKTISLYILTTSIAISVALSIASILDPGITQIHSIPNKALEITDAPKISDVVVNIIPQNPFKALVDGNMLEVIFFALLLGISISLCKEKGKAAGNFFISLNEVILQTLQIVMIVAPIGIFCLIANTFASQGVAMIIELAKYFLTVVFVLMIHMFVVYGSLIKLLTHISPINFYKKIKESIFFAFSTSSSSATIPVTMKNVTENLNVKKKVASFTVPLGSTINMDGTAIMQGVATVFIANIYSQSLVLSDFLTIIITATLASIGTAGVPGVGLIMLGMVLNQVGLPLEGIAIVMGVDRFLDMLRTSVNVSGDAMVSLIINESEK